MNENNLKSPELQEGAENGSDKAPGIDFLLPARELTVTLEGPPCFYCSMTGHSAPECPSRQLSMDIRGLNRVGRLSFSELNTIFQTVFPDYRAPLARLDTGITGSQLAKDKELLVLIAFLDISLLYQLRFLYQIAFSMQPEWQKIGKTAQRNIDRRNLYLGLDYLRVGKYEESRSLLKKEAGDPTGKNFCANVALAFLSLEMGRFSDMYPYLKKAEILANPEKERIYIGFLLSRYHQMNEDVWRSRNAMVIAEKSIYYSDDIAYRKVQLAVETGLDENSVNQLRDLMKESREYLMTALMDPVFIPEQELVENIASYFYSNINHEVEKCLSSLNREFAKLAVWFDDEEENQQNRKEKLEQFNDLYQNRGYYDLLDLAKESKSLTREWRDIFFDQKDAFQRKVRGAERKVKNYKPFWWGYNYQHLFSRFGNNLEKNSKKLAGIRRLINDNTPSSYRKAIADFSDVEKGLEELESMYGRMIWMKTLLDGAWSFGKNLFILEFILMGVALFIGLGIEPALSEFKWGRMLADYDFQRMALSVTAFLIVPLIALIITLKKLSEN